MSGGTTTATSRRDQLFAELLVRHGHCSQTAIEAALQALQGQADEGPPTRLGDLLIRQGVVGMSQVEAVLDELATSVQASCSDCGARVDVLPADLRDGARCPRPECGAVLQSPMAVQTGLLADVAAELDELQETRVLPATRSQPRGSGGMLGGLDALPPQYRDLANDPASWFDKYLLLRQLGKGGMGVVMQAWDTGLQRMVAIKLLRDRVEEDPTHVERFLREARTAAQLVHPGICRTYDVGHIDGRFFIAMEHIEGTPLASPKPARDAASLVRQIAQALDHAHRAGVIHRDIKPSNVLIDMQGRPRVLDFGIAKQVAQESQVTQAGTVVGSPSYMSPEQGHGDPVDARSDVYSLGATLYELLTGSPPFEGKSALETLLKVTRDAPVAPTSRVDGIPPALERICLKALAKQPGRRYQTASEMADALGAFLDGRLPSGAAAPRSRARTGSRSRTDARPSSAGRRATAARAGSGRRPGVRAPASGPPLAWIVGGSVGLVGLLLLVWAATRGASAPTPPPKTTQAPGPSTVPPPTPRPAPPSDHGLAAAQQQYAAALAALSRTGSEPEEGQQALAAAARALSAVIAADPDQLEARRLLARSHYLRHAPVDAERALLEVLERRAADPAALELQAWIRLDRWIRVRCDGGGLRTARLDERMAEVAGEAVRRVEQALAGTGPVPQGAARLRAMGALLRDDYDGCVAVCDAAIEGAPDDPGLYRLRGDARLLPRVSILHQPPTGAEQAALERALADYGEVIRRRPWDLHALLMQAQTELQLGRHRSVKLPAQAALRVAPEDPLGCWLLASYYAKDAELGGGMSALQAAIQWYDKALRRAPDSFANHVGRGIASAKLGRLDAASADFGRALQHDPGHPVASYYRGSIRAKRKQLPGAIADLRRAVAGIPSWGAAWFNLGSLYIGARDYPQAAQALERAVQLRYPPARRALEQVRKAMAGG